MGRAVQTDSLILSEKDWRTSGHKKSPVTLDRLVKSRFLRLFIHLHFI